MIELHKASYTVFEAAEFFFIYLHFTSHSFLTQNCPTTWRRGFRVCFNDVAAPHAFVIKAHLSHMSATTRVRKHSSDDLTVDTRLARWRQCLSRPVTIYRISACRRSLIFYRVLRSSSRNSIVSSRRRRKGCCRGRRRLSAIGTDEHSSFDSTAPAVSSRCS